MADDAEKTSDPDGNGIPGYQDIDRDGVPGTSTTSPSYDQIYNPQGENEDTNLPENPNQLEAGFFLRRKRAEERANRRSLMRSGARIQFWHGVGKFVLPAENTFAAHHELVEHGPTELHFSPSAYPAFDKIIAATCNQPALYDHSNKHYAEFEGMRNNIAVVRNFLFSRMFNDGSFDPGDERCIPLIQEMAKEIGESLKHDSWIGRVTAPAINMKLANIEGEGAAEMYRHLLSRQRPKTTLNWLNSQFLSFFRQPLRQWNLPALEQSPFSEANLYAPPPHTPLSQEQLADTIKRAAEFAVERGAAPAPVTVENAPEEMAPYLKAAQTLLQMVDTLDKKVDRLEQIDAMEVAPKEESVRIGIEILRKLRNLEFQRPEMETLLDTASPPSTDQGRDASAVPLVDPEQAVPTDALPRNIYMQQRTAQRMVKQARKVQQIVEVYERYLEQALRVDPTIRESEGVVEANEAIRTYVHEIKLLAALEIPNAISQAQQIGASQTQDPQRWDELHDRAVDRLMASLEEGIEDALDAIDQQQMDQDRERDEQSHAQDSSQGQSSGQGRRKRRRRQASSSTGKSQIKTDLALKADDFAKGEGRFQQSGGAPAAKSGRVPRAPLPSEAINPAFLSGLDAESMKAVQSAGASLKKATSQGAELKEQAEKTDAEKKADELQQNEKKESERTERRTARREARTQQTTQNEQAAAQLTAAQALAAERARRRRNPNAPQTGRPNS